MKVIASYRHRRAFPFSHSNVSVGNFTLQSLIILAIIHFRRQDEFLSIFFYSIVEYSFDVKITVLKRSFLICRNTSCNLPKVQVRGQIFSQIRLGQYRILIGLGQNSNKRLGFRLDFQLSWVRTSSFRLGFRFKN